MSCIKTKLHTWYSPLTVNIYIYVYIYIQKKKHILVHFQQIRLKSRKQILNINFHNAYI